MIELPFPSSILSGHAKGNGQWRKIKATKELRAIALDKAQETDFVIPATGDIQLHVRFVPPDRRGDRINYLNRMKPIYDGIAEALGINDSRFAIPTFECAEPAKPGCVQVWVR